jgi:Lipocalin-like domain
LNANYRVRESIMHFTRTATFGTSLALLLASQALAQEKSFKEAIIGPWLITAVYDEYQNGEKKDNWGGPVQGQITFGRTGRFTRIIVGPAVASMKTNDPRKPDAPVVAYYGTYTVDESGKKVIGKIEAASYSARAKTDTVWTIQGSGDKLTLIGSPRQDQHGTFSPKLEVSRP